MEEPLQGTGDTPVNYPTDNPWRYETARSDGIVTCARCGRVLRAGDAFVRNAQTHKIVCLRPGASVIAAKARPASPRFVLPPRGRA